jgi:hypothetical protein
MEMDNMEETLGLVLTYFKSLQSILELAEGKKDWELVQTVRASLEDMEVDLGWDYGESDKTGIQQWQGGMDRAEGNFGHITEIQNLSQKLKAGE